ncbi:Myrcene synthase [Quillaja saponaria]|uniref:Myrcene synthase n=1 Tax=Quillaja saponaria TaxID=32244 RepID=A0AAD7PMP5_QUISA|nr:Myrcene synthase [Quillaja saponaria]
MNPILLEFAKLDFNILQATHQEELKHASRWWNRTGLPKKLSFLRDRLMESYIWNLELVAEPQFGHYRRHSAKLYVVMTMVDDLYDSYGTLEELELFTDSIKRWDTSLIDNLPDPMKMLFLAIHNYVNEVAYEVLRDQGFNIIPCLKKYWEQYCQSYLVEAKWLYNGYRPSLQEYLDNGWISIGVLVTQVHAYFTIANPIKKEALDCLEEGCPNIIHWTAVIVRLADDLGTFSRDIETRDPNSSVQYYMNEKGTSKEEARNYIRCLIDKTWKKINGDRFASSPVSSSFCRNVCKLFKDGTSHIPAWRWLYKSSR